MQFYWTVPTLAKLKDRSLTMKVYEEISGKSKVIGSLCVSLKIKIITTIIEHPQCIYRIYICICFI